MASGGGKGLTVWQRIEIRMKNMNSPEKSSWKTVNHKTAERSLFKFIHPSKLNDTPLLNWPSDLAFFWERKVYDT